MRIAPRFPRRLAHVVACASLAIATLAIPPQLAAAHPANSAVGDGSNAVSVSIAPSDSTGTGSTGVWISGSRLDATVSLSNDGPAPLPAGEVEISLTGSAFATASDLAAWLGQSDTGKPGALGAVEKREPTPRVPAGGQVVLPTVSLPASLIAAVATDTQQVRGLAVSFGNSERQNAIGRTAVVINPSSGATPVRVCVIIPLTTPPGTLGLIPKDTLARYTAPDGLLTRQLDGVVGHDRVAIGIDPRIIASIRALGTSAPPSATAWLGELEQAPNEIFPLSYGDADVSVQAQSGLKKLLAPTSLAYALNPGDHPGQGTVGETPQPSDVAAGSTPTPTSQPGGLPTLDHLLAWPYTDTDTDIAWPPDNTVTRKDIPVFAASGLTSTLVSSTNVNGAKGTQGAIAQLGNGDVALIWDAAVSRSLRNAVSAPSQQAWGAAMSAVSGQLALTSQAAKGTQPTVLLTMGREQKKSPPARLNQSLSTLDTLPWATPIPLSVLRADAPTSGMTIKDSPEPDSRVDAVEALAGPGGDEHAIAGFATALSDPAMLTGRQRAELLTLLGAGWLDPGNNWSAALATNQAKTRKTLQAIQIIVPPNFNLFSSNAPLPITISNELAYPATVVLHATASNPRLDIGNDVTKTLEGSSHAKALLPVEARLGNGKVTLNLSLDSPKGVPIGHHASVPVNVRADWEGVGALILGILVVALFAFGITRNIARRRRAAKEPPAEPEPEPAGEAPRD